MASLAAAIAPRAASLQSTPVLPVPDERARQLGPNLVVVYEPGSVEDLALLWNLRMANGLPDGLPLGVPRNADPLAAIRHWQQEFAFQMWTLGHDRCALTSTTVETSEARIPCGRSRGALVGGTPRGGAARLRQTFAKEL